MVSLGSTGMQCLAAMLFFFGSLVFPVSIELWADLVLVSFGYTVCPKFFDVFPQIGNLEKFGNEVM